MEAEMAIDHLNAERLRTLATLYVMRDALTEDQRDKLGVDDKRDQYVGYLPRGTLALNEPDARRYISYMNKYIARMVAVGAERPSDAEVDAEVAQLGVTDITEKRSAEDWNQLWARVDTALSSRALERETREAAKREEDEAAKKKAAVKAEAMAKRLDDETTKIAALRARVEIAKAGGSIPEGRLHGLEFAVLRCAVLGASLVREPYQSNAAARFEREANVINSVLDRFRTPLAEESDIDEERPALRNMLQKLVDNNTDSDALVAKALGDEYAALQATADARSAAIAKEAAETAREDDAKREADVEKERARRAALSSAAANAVAGAENTFRKIGALSAQLETLHETRSKQALDHLPVTEFQKMQKNEDTEELRRIDAELSDLSRLQLALGAVQGEPDAAVRGKLLAQVAELKRDSDNATEKARQTLRALEQMARTRRGTRQYSDWAGYQVDMERRRLDAVVLAQRQAAEKASKEEAEAKRQQESRSAALAESKQMRGALWMVKKMYDYNLSRVTAEMKSMAGNTAIPPRRMKWKTVIRDTVAATLPRTSLRARAIPRATGVPESELEPVEPAQESPVSVGPAVTGVGPGPASGAAPAREGPTPLSPPLSPMEHPGPDHGLPARPVAAPRDDDPPTELTRKERGDRKERMQRMRKVAKKAAKAAKNKGRSIARAIGLFEAMRDLAVVQKETAARAAAEAAELERAADAAVAKRNADFRAYADSRMAALRAREARLAANAKRIERELNDEKRREAEGRAAAAASLIAAMVADRPELDAIAAAAGVGWTVPSGEDAVQYMLDDRDKKAREELAARLRSFVAKHIKAITLLRERGAAATHGANAVAMLEVIKRAESNFTEMRRAELEARRASPAYQAARLKRDAEHREATKAVTVIDAGAISAVTTLYRHLAAEMKAIASRDSRTSAALMQRASASDTEEARDAELWKHGHPNRLAAVQRQRALFPVYERKSNGVLAHLEDDPVQVQERVREWEERVNQLASQAVQITALYRTALDTSAWLREHGGTELSFDRSADVLGAEHALEAARAELAYWTVRRDAVVDGSKRAIARIRQKIADTKAKAEKETANAKRLHGDPTRRGVSLSVLAEAMRAAYNKISRLWNDAVALRNDATWIAPGVYGEEEAYGLGDMEADINAIEQSVDAVNAMTGEVEDEHREYVLLQAEARDARAAEARKPVPAHVLVPGLKPAPPVPAVIGPTVEDLERAVADAVTEVEKRATATDVQRTIALRQYTTTDGIVTTSGADSRANVARLLASAREWVTDSDKATDRATETAIAMTVLRERLIARKSAAPAAALSQPDFEQHAAALRARTVLDSLARDRVSLATTMIGLAISCLKGATARASASDDEVRTGTRNVHDHAVVIGTAAVEMSTEDKVDRKRMLETASAAYTDALAAYDAAAAAAKSSPAVAPPATVPAPATAPATPAPAPAPATAPVPVVPVAARDGSKTKGEAALYDMNVRAQDGLRAAQQRLESVGRQVYPPCTSVDETVKKAYDACVAAHTKRELQDAKDQLAAATAYEAQVRVVENACAEQIRAMHSETHPVKRDGWSQRVAHTINQCMAKKEFKDADARVATFKIPRAARARAGYDSVLEDARKYRGRIENNLDKWRDAADKACAVPGAPAIEDDAKEDVAGYIKITRGLIRVVCTCVRSLVETVQWSVNATGVLLEGDAWKPARSLETLMDVCTARTSIGVTLPVRNVGDMVDQALFGTPSPGRTVSLVWLIAKCAQLHANIAKVPELYGREIDRLNWAIATTPSESLAGPAFVTVAPMSDLAKTLLDVYLVGPNPLTGILTAVTVHAMRTGTRLPSFPERSPDRITPIRVMASMDPQARSSTYLAPLFQHYLSRARERLVRQCGGKAKDPPEWRNAVCDYLAVFTSAANASEAATGNRPGDRPGKDPAIRAKAVSFVHAAFDGIDRSEVKSAQWFTNLIDDLSANTADPDSYRANDDPAA